jgi:indolepyruvate ferredoxin oxidoreductase beta subunit
MVFGDPLLTLADLLVGFEPVETLREIGLIKKDGLVVMSSHVQHPVAVSMGKAEYPTHEEIHRALRVFTNRVIEFDAFALAQDAGSTRSLNMVMLGAVIGSNVTPISKESALQAVRSSFPERFEKVNVKAAESGISLVRERL